MSAKASVLDGTMGPPDAHNSVPGVVVFEFSIPVAGDATGAGPAPPYDALLEACGLDGPSDGGAHTEYTLDMNMQDLSAVGESEC